MAVKERLSVFEQLANQTNFSNAYLCYGFNHPRLTESVIDFVYDYFKQHEESFSYSRDAIEHCSDIIVYSELTTIKIDDVREIKDRVKYGANHFSRLFVIIDSAENMTVEAANAFLKVCEEPLETVTFFLCTANIKAIMPTILSRCQHIFCNSDESSLVLEQGMISFFDYVSMGLLDRFAFGTELAANKALINSQLEYWLHEIHQDLNTVTLHHEASTLIISVLERFQFNVNAKAQLDALAISL